MLRTLLILSFVSSAVGCTPGEFSYPSTGPTIPTVDPSLATQFLPARTYEECRSLGIEHSVWGQGYYAATETSGCLLYNDKLYWNHGGINDCTESEKCVLKCYTSGCNDDRASNYVAGSYAAIGCTGGDAPSGTLKTCDSTGWCEGDTDANGREFYVVEKVEGYNCAFVPDNGEIDLSNIDTGGKPMYIGRNIFEGCLGLTSIKLHDLTERIGYGAFKGTSLNTLTLPDSVVYIGLDEAGTGAAPSSGGVGIDETDCVALKAATSTACAATPERVCVQRVVFN